MPCEQSHQASDGDTLPIGRIEGSKTPIEPYTPLIRYFINDIDPTATLLLTVEGERDDICAFGQAVAAHDLCSKLRLYLKRHHMQAGIGHYGVFSRRRRETQIYPILKNVILPSD